MSKGHGRLAQLGEHLPYKQGVIGSSPIATIICPSGGTGRRTGLKILRANPSYRFDSGLGHTFNILTYTNSLLSRASILY